jgi:putative hydrolase of the HAD superfamily
MNSPIAYANVIERDPLDVGWEQFAGVDTWIFDLDDTLYPRSAGLHRQLKGRVIRFIADLMKLDDVQAEAIHSDYYERYGATLQGLMELHGVAAPAFLDFVHAIDLSQLRRDVQLIECLALLPGRLVVFTNSARSHATAVLSAMGLSGLFDGIYSIEDCNFVGKPQQSAYAGLLAAHDINPQTSAMFDDRVGNLAVPHALGIRTVLIAETSRLQDSPPSKPSHVDVLTPDLTEFLVRLVRSIESVERKRKQSNRCINGQVV